MKSKDLLTNDGAWSPYLAGTSTGLLVIIGAYLSAAWLGNTEFLGASTTYARVSGFILRLVFPDYVSSNEYYNELKLCIDWEFMLVIGIILGSFISSIADKTFKLEKMPPVLLEMEWKSAGKRAVVAFLGGIVCLFGTRLAGGCPSGNGLSGMIQLSASGFVFFITFFLTSVIVARLLYGKRSS